MEGERKVNPDCVNASNPFHQCAEYCVQRAHGSKPRSPRPKLVGEAQNEERRKEDRGIEATERNADPSCRNAPNPYHECADYCSPKNHDVKGLKAKISVENGVKMENNHKNREIENTEGKKTAQNEERRKEDRGIVIVERHVDPSCFNVSDAEHFSAIKPEVERQDEKRSVENGLKMWDNGVVDPKCANVSNPYHVCAQYCLQRRNEMENTVGHKSVAMVPTGERHKEHRGIIAADRNVDPLCPNAYNRYDHCVEYHPPRKSEVKDENKEKRSGENGVTMEHNEMVEKERIHPNCVNASNPYHHCAEYCFKKMNPLT